MKKRFFVLVLTICLLAGLLPVLVGAEETQPSTVSTTETTAPTTIPTTEPTTASTIAPTTEPTTVPTTEPTTVPTTEPTTAPTTEPTTVPTTEPTTVPTTEPTTVPTTEPTTAPTVPPVQTNGVSVKLCEEDKGNFAVVLTAYEGREPVYAETRSSGVPSLVTDGSIPLNNYVKLEYPKDGTPVLSIKGAYLKAYGDLIDLSAFNQDVTVVVETDSILESTTGRGIRCRSDLTVVGPGKLSLQCLSSGISLGENGTRGSLILKELRLEALSIGDSVAPVVLVPAGNLTVKDSTLTFEHRSGAAIFVGKGNVDDADNRGKITVTNTAITVVCADTAFESEGDILFTKSTIQATAGKYAVYTDGNLTAKDSAVVLSSEHDKRGVLDVWGVFTIDGSTVELTGTAYPVFASGTTPVFVGNLDTKGGSSREDAAAYEEAKADTYRYFLAAPAGAPPTVPTTAPTIAPTTAPTTIPTESTAAPTSVPTTVPTAPPITAPSQPIEPVGSGSSKVLLWILAVVLVLGAAGAAVAAVMMLRKKDNSEGEY